MISLMPYTSIHNSSLSYCLDDEQSVFTSLPSTWFDDDLAYKIVIEFNNTAIGFFVLDNGNDKLNYSDDKSALLLRSMSINPIFQGKGYAKIALLQLSDFLKKQDIMATKIVLGVNHKNILAQRLYEKVGFKKLEHTLMGENGLQYIYELSL